MIADRLRLARRKAGYSLRDLSNAMDGKVTAQAIGKYERGESTPSSGVLSALSKALGVSLGYLLDSQGVELSGVEFRTKANTSARDRARVETEVLEWIERYLQVERVLELDSAKWACPIDPPRTLRSPDEGEKLAEDVLLLTVERGGIRFVASLCVGPHDPLGLHAPRQVHLDVRKEIRHQPGAQLLNDLIVF